MCIFGKIFNKMATKQYLDAETIPYQVILREADGSYTDQFPQSFYVSREGNGFRANGGTGAHFLKRDFSAIDWGACLPLPNPIPTDTEGYMAWLSTYFTGQMGTLIPTTTMSLGTIYSQPFTLNLTADGLYCASPVGVPDVVNRDNVVVPAGYTVISIAFYAKGNNDIAVPFRIYAFDPDANETIIMSDSIPANQNGVITFAAPSEIQLPADWTIGIEYAVPSGTGSLEISGSAMFVRYEIK
jgi:hypothetical protein